MAAVFQRDPNAFTSWGEFIRIPSLSALPRHSPSWDATSLVLRISDYLLLHLEAGDAGASGPVTAAGISGLRTLFTAFSRDESVVNGGTTADVLPLLSAASCVLSAAKRRGSDHPAVGPAAALITDVLESCAGGGLEEQERPLVQCRIVPRWRPRGLRPAEETRFHVDTALSSTDSILTGALSRLGKYGSDSQETFQTVPAGLTDVFCRMATAIARIRWCAKAPYCLIVAHCDVFALLLHPGDCASQRSQLRALVAHAELLPPSPQERPRPRRR